MFVGPPSKLKWSVDPRNTAWSNDTSQFGHKMLKKMGWEKGKGLGANENGLTEAVKLSGNKNTKGLGCTASYDYTWMAHQDDFSSLLSELNASNSQKADAKMTKSEVVCLEKTSRSQKGLRYHKFTKGKNLSNYNEADMVGILGIKKSLNGKNGKSEVDSTPYSKNSETSDSAEKLVTTTALIVAQNNVDDYFKLKRQKRMIANAVEDRSESKLTENCSKTLSVSQKEIEVNNQDVKQLNSLNESDSTKKKSAKKRKSDKSSLVKDVKSSSKKIKSKKRKH